MRDDNLLLRRAYEREQYRAPSIVAEFLFTAFACFVGVLLAFLVLSIAPMVALP